MLLKASFRRLSYVTKYSIFRFFLLFGINIYHSKYDLIPQATRFMRNVPLLNNIFELLKSNNKQIRCFFHAGSTGEEVYSFLIFNDKNYKLDLDVVAGEYEEDALSKIKEAKYSKETIFPTPTIPYLTDYNKKIEHFFKYSIFIKKEQ